VRVELALALMGTERFAEAGAELREALREPGDEPPDWRIHFHLGVLEQQAGSEPLEVFSRFLTAALASPAPAAEEPVARALQMLEDHTAARRWTSGLDRAQVDLLLSRALSGGAPASMVSLASQLSLLRGDAETAGSLISTMSDDRLRADPALGTAQTVAEAIRSVDQGDFESALALLDRSEVAREPTAAAARAMALYGIGRLDQALDSAAGAQVTFETAMAQALVWLRRAAEGSETDAQMADAFAQAGRAASTAARLAPTLGDGLLLRAQVELEASHDIDEGRRLLQKALRKLERDPDRARLWRLQRRVRDDDRFRYVSLEVAAACDRREDLLAVHPERLPFLRTTVLQDAALAELIARAKHAARELDDSATLFDRSADWYVATGQPDHGLEVRRVGNSIRPTTDGLIKLAREEWQASFRGAEEGRQAADQVGNGLAALDRLDGSPLDQDASQRVEAAYMRGLLLARHAELVPATLPDRWRPLPWLLAAALDDPSHSYRAAHLAWALNSAAINRAALHFAERALSLDEHDEWLMETFVVMHMNWYGVLDPRTQDLIDAIGHETWGPTVRAIDALDRGDLQGLRAHLDSVTHDAYWAREVRARGTARLDGIGQAEPLLRSLLDEATSEPINHFAAADAALALRDLDAARRYIEQGRARNQVNPRVAEYTGALIDMLAGSDEAPGVLSAKLSTAINPFLLRSWANAELPILVDTWAQDARAVELLEALRRECLERIDQLPSAVPLTAEVDQALVTSSDPALDKVVRELLHAEARGGVADPAAAEMLRNLAAEAGVPSYVGPLLAATATP
jgi:hypothetical protein